MLSTNSYAENFAEKFPSVSLNQSWDYSTGGFVLKSGTRAGENVSIQGHQQEVAGRASERDRCMV
jgi:hypothetical protein